MKNVLALLVLCFAVAGQAASYTEWYVDAATGANTNSGSTATAPVFSHVSGNWTNSTAKFFASGADLSGVDVGMWASVYADGAAVAAFTSVITEVDDTADTITLSATAKAGTNPSDIVGTGSITVGGSWAGPAGTSYFPFAYAIGTLTNSSGNVARVNFKAGTDYTTTAVFAHALAGPLIFQGYTTTPGDLGKATLFLNLASPGDTHVKLQGANNDIADFIFYSNSSGGTTGGGLSVGGTECTAIRCVAHDYRSYGIRLEQTGCSAISCEAYNCNKSASAGGGGFLINAATATLVNCVSHSNTAGNSSGFVSGSSGSFIMLNCIASSNLVCGVNHTSALSAVLQNCDFYENATGFDASSANPLNMIFVSCNFVKNSSYGINSSGSLFQRNGYVLNCGFGAGTMANGTDIVANLQGVQVLGSVSYDANVVPWVDPETGDYRLTLAAAKGAGYGVFTQTPAGYSGTIGYPDIGAAQSLPAAGGGQTSYTWAQ